MGARPLLLFDLDGTLLQPADPLHSIAFQTALAELVGFRGAIDWSGTSGMVDRAILVLLFERCGVAPAEARRLAGPGCRTMASTYRAHTYDASVGDRTLPGVRALLAALSQRGAPMGLLTGNVGAIARGRVLQAGLQHHFLAGAFGHEALRRSTLVRRAIQRCSRAASRSFASHEVIVIGDTPRDVQAAHQAGARCLAVATGNFSAAELAAARPEALVADV